MDTNKITILAENYAYKAPLAEWGFSALIEVNYKKFLFDVGYTGTCLIENAKKLGVDIKNVEAIVLSHGHYDHANGLEAVLNYIGARTIYAHPDVFTKRYSLKDDKLEYSGIKLSKGQLEKDYGVKFKLYEGFTEISKDLSMTGEVPFTNDFEKISPHFKVKKNEREENDCFPDDNSLVIDTAQGLIIVFGCAHRGLVNICSYVKKIKNRPIYAIIGGTHLFDVDDEHFNFVVEYLRKEEVKLIAPSHCTGIHRVFDFKSIFKEKVTPAFCGEQFLFM